MLAKLIVWLSLYLDSMYLQTHTTAVWDMEWTFSHCTHSNFRFISTWVYQLNEHLLFLYFILNLFFFEFVEIVTLMKP
jgi:hypothetical protein